MPARNCSDTAPDRRRLDTNRARRRLATPARAGLGRAWLLKWDDSSSVVRLLNCARHRGVSWRWRQSVRLLAADGTLVHRGSDAARIMVQNTLYLLFGA